MSNAGSEENTFLAIYPMWKSNPPERKHLVDKIIAQYKPVCNQEN